jgi:hypothetical protein
VERLFFGHGEFEFFTQSRKEESGERVGSCSLGRKSTFCPFITGAIPLIDDGQAAQAISRDNGSRCCYRARGLKMQIEALNAVTEQINAGAEVASVEPVLIEQMWKAMSSIPRELRQGTLTGVHAVAPVDPGSLPQVPEQRVGMMVRYAVMDALIERGILDEYMKDEAQRKKVFAAAALFPCDKNDLGEAVAQQLARIQPSEIAQKTHEELQQGGYDPEHPKVGERFIAWMRDHC